MRNYYFEKLVRQAVAALPSAAKGAMNNVAFVIEDEARRKRAGETIWHEVGHHLGFDEKKIRALETRRNKKL